MNRIDRTAGCLLGGAAGDALGAAVEFMSIGEIRVRYGSDGIRSYAPAYGRLGAITDDTQMTLFTLEGLLRAAVRLDREGDTSISDCVRLAYIRWLGTQGTLFHRRELDWIYGGFLWRQKDLHSRRAPGNTCLSSLQHHMARLERDETGGDDGQPINDSKGCGGVMRMAPVGFFDLDCFKTGCELAQITHGHPSGYLSAGFLAHLVRQLRIGASLEEAIESARRILLQWPAHEEVLRAVDSAVESAKGDDATPEAIERLGTGWVAEEALAISLFCALKAEDFAHGVRLAVNHSGDSDSTGAITGNILGAIAGRSAIPDEFLADLELREVIERMARDVVDFGYTDDWWERYPGC